MKATPSILLLDTNIWLDNYLGTRLHSKESKKLITECHRQEITLAYPATSIKDVFYCIGAKLKRSVRTERGELTESDALACNELAWACIQNMMEIAVATTVAEPQIALARLYKKHDGDFEDDIILATMEYSKADYLVTNDEVLQKKSPFPTLSSADMLTVLDACVV